MKRIALFFDGTWNSPKDNTNVNRLKEGIIGPTSMEGAPLEPDDETNVFRLFSLMRARRSFRVLLGELVEDRPPEGREDGPRSEWEQIKYYHRGVGERFGESLIGGIFGYGVSRNIQEPYLWLARHFEAGDEVFLFGFSRGAFTARSFAGLINRCGILMDQELTGLQQLVKEAYKIYSQNPVDEKEANWFRNKYSHTNPDPHIKFIGVWDTVGALGVNAPFRLIGESNFAWHDTDLKPIVRNACHALALDEHRPDFEVMVWPKSQPPVPGQHVEQRWFIGAHSNVGGGYKGDRLPDISLQWMQEKAKVCHLEFTSDVVVDDDAYLDPIVDSYDKFLLHLYKYKCERNFRRLKRGISETADLTILQRLNSDIGLDEQLKKYEIRNTP